MRLYHFKVNMYNSGNMRDRFTLASDVNEARRNIEENDENVRTAHQYVNSYKSQGDKMWGDDG